MVCETVKPGDVLFVLERFVDVVSRKTVKVVFGTGVAFTDSTEVFCWGVVFASEADARKSLIARAMADVIKAEKELNNAKSRLAKLEKTARPPHAGVKARER